MGKYSRRARHAQEFAYCLKSGKIYGERNGFRKLKVSGFVHHAHMNGMYIEVVKDDSGTQIGISVGFVWSYFRLAFIGICSTVCWESPDRISSYAQ